MRAVFGPATNLVGRLRFAQKFVVVGLVLLLPLGFVVRAYVDLQRAQSDFSAKERIGIEYMVPVIELTAAVVEVRHRAVGGRSARRLDLAEGIARIDALDARYGELLQTTKRWRDTTFLLGVAAASTAPRSAFLAYNNAVDSLLLLIVQIGDQSNLTLDPDLDTYYLMDALQFRLPLLLDTSGRLIDRALVGRRAVEDDPTLVFIELGLDNGKLVSTSEAITSGMRTAVWATGSTELPRLVEEDLPRLHAATEVLVDDVTEAVRIREVEALAPYDASAASDEALRFAAVVAAELDRLLAQRIAGFSRNAERVQLFSLLAGLLALYLFVGFYLSVTTPLRRMVATLRAVAQGDLSASVTVGTRDELGFIGTALNDTVEKVRVARGRLAHQATHDELTGLPNRSLVLERLDEAFQRMDGSDLLALLFIDLDRFKIVNDSMGHKAGDELLCTVASRLREHVRAQDTVGRLGGDEFVVICEELESIDEATAVAARIGLSVSAPIGPVEGSLRTVNVGASIGIATASRRSRVAPTDLIRDADVAMYHAKQQGRGRVVVFDEALRVAVQQRLETQEDLRRAITEGQLSVAYQRVVDVEAGETPTFEALVRWEHPQRGWLPPAEFIPIAEETGLIVPLGAWVLREACRDAARWRVVPRTAAVGVSVNLSARQLAESSLVAMVAGVLRETGLEADALWLEITETALMDDAEAASATLAELRALGVHLAIDDFGTGYSSLAYLRRFPVEVLKIDRSFVERLGEDAEDAAVVDLVVHLARALNLTVIAEGVETDVQLRALRRLGCRRVQGYYFGRPLPVAEALAALTGQAPAAPQTADTARVAAPLG